MLKTFVSFATAFTFISAASAYADNIHDKKNGTLVLQQMRTAPGTVGNHGKSKTVSNMYIGKSASNTQNTYK